MRTHTHTQMKKLETEIVQLKRRSFSNRRQRVFASSSPNSEVVILTLSRPSVSDGNHVTFKHKIQIRQHSGDFKRTSKGLMSLKEY